MNSKLNFMLEDLNALSEVGLDFHSPVLSSGADARITVNGQRALNFASNNYLGLVNHPELKEAAKKAVDQ